MNGVALIAFDCRDGRILSTFLYGSIDEPKADEVAGRRERLMSEVAKKVETDRFDILEIPLRDFPALGMIDRVDPESRKLVKRRAEA